MPGDPFYQIWKILCLVVTLVSSIMYGYFAAMRKDVEYETYESFKDDYDSKLEPCFYLSEESIR